MIQTRQQRWATLAPALVCFALFAILMVLVTGPGSLVTDLDHHVELAPYRWTLDHSWIHHVATAVSTATQPNYVVLAGLVAAIALAVRGLRRAGIWTVLVLAAARGAYPLFKNVVERPRPALGATDPIGGWSFPSGHVTEISAAMGIVVVAATLFIRRRSVRRLLVALAATVVVIVGLDRVLLGVHFVSDLVGGLLLGVGITLLLMSVFDPRPRSIALAQDALSSTGPPRVRALGVVLNPIKIDDPGGFHAMVEKIAAESGVAEVTWWETTAEDTGYRMAHEAAVSGVDLVIAIGGDGTIRAVCEELAGTGVPVGIVPAGTGNLLARNLSIPLYLRAAVDVAINGQDRAIDLVRVSGDEMEDATFLVMAGMGFDAAIMEGVNEDFKKHVGWLAYAWSALKTLMFPAMRIEVSVDGEAFTRHRARTVVIGNVGNLQAGMPLIPDAAIDDGQLDVVLLYPRRFLSWLPLAARVLTKDKRTDELITRMKGRSVVVRTPTAAPRQLDGDLIEPGRELRAECDHGRVLVRVPR
ncbi:MAG: dagK 2 [Marmoricola sp.]|nr:dagK 2 [Marmoricola sp.]